jgi:uncharacterized damage-inducible protein DinB
VEGCIVSLNRCLDVIAQFERTGGPYASIGPQLRHCVDHFTCLLRGLEGGLVDYDARDRDERTERDAAQCAAALDRIIEALRKIRSDELPRKFIVRQIPAPDRDAAPVASTLERELLFLSGHTIHHLAIVSLIAEHVGVTLPEDVSVAYSTAAHRAGQAAG